jgi:hypothetical protein
MPILSDLEWEKSVVIESRKELAMLAPSPDLALRSCRKNLASPRAISCYRVTPAELAAEVRERVDGAVQALRLRMDDDHAR